MTAAWTLDAESRGALAELLNPGVVRAADMLTELTGENVEVQLSAVRISSADMPGGIVRFKPPISETIITQAFAGALRGRASLSFAAIHGISLAKALSGRLPADIAELDSELSSVLLEVGNIVLNGVMGSLASALPADLRYALPELCASNGQNSSVQANSLDDGNVLLGDVLFRVSEQAFEGTITIACAPGGVHQLLESLLEPIPTT